MRNFNFFEKLWEHSRTLRRVGLVLVMCLITITQMWADDRGFWDTDAGYVRFYRNNAYEYGCTVNKDGVSDFSLGNIDSDDGLYWTDAYAKVWGGTDIFNNITFKYRVKGENAGSGPSWSDYGLNWHDNMGGTTNQFWNVTSQKKYCSVSGLAAGYYEVEFYFEGGGKDGNTYYANNNGGNYHANFTLRRKITYHDTNKTSGSAPDEEWWDGAATVRDNTGLLQRTGYVFAGWATSADRAAAGTIDHEPGTSSMSVTLTANLDLYPVWKPGSYFISLTGKSTNGVKNTTDFIASQSLSNTATEVNGVTFSKSYYQTGGDQSSIKQGYQNANRFIVYDTKSTMTTMRVYVKNTHSSGVSLWYYLAKEGSTSETDQSVSLTSGETKVININASNSKGTRVIFCSGDADQIRITQIIAIESGTTLPLPGETDYELAFPGRVASHFKTINGIEVAGESSNLKWNYDVELRLQSGSSKYVKFTTPASPSQMLLTTLSGKGGYVCTDKNSPSTTGVYFPSVSKTTEHKINLSASTTYYIMGETSSNTCISKIAFTDAPTITYDANDGSGSMSPSKNIVSSNSFTAPSGKTFVNWNTKANGSGAAYAPGDYAYSDVKLYAQWGYALTYDKNTTDEVTNMPASPIGVKTGSMNLASEVPVRSGYIFVGWQVAGAGTVYQPEGSYTMPSSAVTMKAKWVAEDMKITDARKSSSWGSDKENGDAITSTNIEGTISGGNIVCSNSSGTLGGNSTYGLVFDNNKDQITVTVADKTFVAGSVIVLEGYSVNTNSTSVGFTASSNAFIQGNYTTTAAENQKFRRTYIVGASDGIITTSSFTLARSTNNKVYLYSLQVGGCEEVSCLATTPGAISKGAASGGTGTITLTAAGSAATNNTWYWQSAADGTATNLGSGATKDVSATGTYYLRSYCSDNGGCWSDAVSVTVAAADLLTTPTATFSNSYYIIGGSSLDLSSLWTSDSGGSVTYSVQSAGGTGASISTATFTATTAGTATVRASQAANGNYSAITKDATITVLPGYATSIDFEGIIDDSGTSAAWKTTMEGQNYKLAQSDGSKWTLDDGTSGTKQADKGLKIKETGDNAGKIAFAVHANQTVELKVGTLAGTGNGKASFSINGGASYSDITGASTASTGTPVTHTYKGNADRVYVFKTKSSSWNILQHITIGYKVTYDKGTYGTGTVDPMYKTHGTSLTLSSSTFSRDGYDQDGWSTSDGGDKVYDLGGSYTSNAEITLYPHWVVACSAPTSPSISGTTSYTVGNTISLTASATGTSGSTTYTWYKGATWDDAKDTSPVQTTSTSGATFSKASCVVADAGKYWCNISNGTGCDVQVGQAITVAKADISPVLTYDPSTLIQGVNSPTPTVTGNPGSGGVTYTISTSSPADIATVNSSTGVVSSTGTGSITVTATVAATTNYNSGTATFDLTIRAPYTVTFNPNGGSVTPTSATENSYDGVSLPTPTWASHTFQGWFLGETNVGKTGKYKPSASVTLYAGWKETCAGDPDVLISITPTITNDNKNNSSATASGTIGGTAYWDKMGTKSPYKLNNDDAYFALQLTSGNYFADDDVLVIEGSDKAHDIYAGSHSNVAGATSLGVTSYEKDKTIYYTLTSLPENTSEIFVYRASDTYNGKLSSIYVTRGESTPCYYVTYDGNGATSGYTSDPKAYEADDDPVVKANGFERTGYEFVGWYTKASVDGTGTWYQPSATISNIASNMTLYAQWRVLISSDNTNFSGYTSVGSSDDVRVTNGATLTITSTRTIHDIIIDDGATLNVSTNSGSAITFTVNSLHLKGGWNAGKTKYDMPRVYIDPKSSLSKSESTVNFDITVDQSNYYPIALPFDVVLNTDGNVVDYVNSSIASISTYGTHYAIKEYRGDLRAENGPDRQNNWTLVAAGSTLKAGKGYILSGLNVGGRAEIRFPLSFTNAWTTEGEQGTVSAVTKNVVAVTAHTGKATEGDKYANKGWNLLGVPFMSCYATGSDMYAGEGAASIIQGKFNFDDGTWDGEDPVRYVNVPVHDFSEYIQTDITSAGSVLRPGWCFFVQIETGGNLKFLTADQAASSSLPIYAPKRTAEMPTVKTGIVLSGNGASDKTTLLISDKYNGAEYEINADLEKMFGNGYTLATYSLSNDTRLAYNAMSRSDAQLAIPIGYRAPAEGSYTFSINPRYAESGAFSRVDLIDYEAGTLTNLLMSDYTFTTERTQNDTRFAINVVLAPQVTTDIESVNGEGLEVNGVRKVLINNELYIVVDGKMFDATGKAVR